MKKLTILLAAIGGTLIVLLVGLFLSSPAKCKRTYSELTSAAKKVSTELNQAPSKYRDEYKWEIEMENIFPEVLLTFDKSEKYVNYDGNGPVYISIDCAKKCPLLLGGKKTWLKGDAGTASEISNLGLHERHGEKLNNYIARYYFDNQYYQVSVTWKNDESKANEILNKIIGLDIVK